MKLKTNLTLNMGQALTRRVWIDENCDLFILIRGEKEIIQPNHFALRLPGNIRYHKLGESKEKTT